MVSRMPPSTVAGMSLYDWGGPERAPVLLLLHGLTDSGESWTDAVSRWTPHYRVLSWDARGHGTSPRFSPEQLAAGVAETMAADAIAVLEELAAQGLSRPLLVGHSMGGGTAGLVAGLRPDLVAGVVLEDPALGTDPEETEEDRREAGAERVRDAQAWRDDPETAMAKGVAENPDWPPTEYAGWGRAKRQTDLAMLATGQARPQRHWQHVAGAIAAPTLLVAADEPYLWGHDELARLRALGNSQLRVELLPGSAHCVRRTRTEEFHALVDPWIAGLFGARVRPGG